MGAFARIAIARIFPGVVSVASISARVRRPLLMALSPLPSAHVLALAFGIVRLVPAVGADVELAPRARREALRARGVLAVVAPVDVLGAHRAHLARLADLVAAAAADLLAAFALEEALGARRLLAVRAHFGAIAARPIVARAALGELAVELLLAARLAAVPDLVEVDAVGHSAGASPLLSKRLLEPDRGLAA